MANGPTKVVMEGVYTSNHPLGPLDVPKGWWVILTHAQITPRKKLVIGWGGGSMLKLLTSHLDGADTDRWGSLKIGYLGTPQNQLVDNGQLGIFDHQNYFLVALPDLAPRCPT